MGSSIRIADRPFPRRRLRTITIYLVPDLDVILAPALCSRRSSRPRAPLSRRGRHARDAAGPAHLRVAGPLDLDRPLSSILRTVRARRHQRDAASDRRPRRRRGPGMARLAFDSSDAHRTAKGRHDAPEARSDHESLRSRPPHRDARARRRLFLPRPRRDNLRAARDCDVHVRD